MLTAEHLLPAGVVFTATGGSYGGGIWLDTGAADDTVYVQNTLPNVKTLVTTGHGADTIRLSSNATMQGNLSTIQGPIKVDAGPGGNYLELAVFDDAAKDKLRGNAALDWFFAKLSNPKKDKLLDYTAGLGEDVDLL